MAFPGEATARTSAPRNGHFTLQHDRDPWSTSADDGRDWKKLVLIIGLGALSWVATYIGMLELIESNMGELPLTHKAVIGFSVAMLMTMIVWLLDQMFAPLPLTTKFSYVAGYVFLTIISVGFGFGFYWKVLESRSEASRSAESAVGQVQSAMHGASTRLQQLSATLEQLTAVSGEKAAIERDKGTSCPNSRPGDGPRRKLRDDDAQRFGFAAEMVKGRAAAVTGELKALDGDLAKIASADPSTFDAKTGTRNEFMKGLGRKLDMTVTGFNAFRSDPQLRQIRSDLADRAERTTFPDGKGGTFFCPDAQLQTALKGVVGAIDQLPLLEKPEIAAVEGSEATIEAFRRLTATFYGMLAFKLPPSADELRELQKKAVQSVEQPAAGARAAHQIQAGLSKRDYIPLAVALFVDLCLLLVSMGRPINRLHGLVPKMRAAEQGPVIEILSRFNEIHRDPAIRENFEVFRHVVFDHHGSYYVAVPLDAPARMNPEEREALRLEAHLLANLFTSFEKERIFTRVLQPLITTAGIRKKLWRQGSKFAGSEAFRVYKFRDGAWSEIVLGAVMGAARRVEGEKRRRAACAADQPSSGPTLAPANDVPFAPTTGFRPVDWPSLDAAAACAAAAPGSTSNAPPRHTATDRPRRAAPSAVPRDPSRATAEWPIPSHIDAKFGIYARAAGDELSRARADTEREQDEHREAAVSITPAGGSPEVHEPVADEVAARAANSNTLPHPRFDAAMSPAGRRLAVVPEESAKVIALPGVKPLPPGPASEPTSLAAPDTASEPQPAKSSETIDVVLRRETATFTVPVSEAALPHSLARMMGRRIDTARALAVEDQLELTLPEAAPMAIVPPNEDPGEDAADPDLSPEAMTLARRFAPPAAE
ncbi:MAG: hypothetical protein AB1749_11310 [Pseudomonadota bacterium]